MVRTQRSIVPDLRGRQKSVRAGVSQVQHTAIRRSGDTCLRRRQTVRVTQAPRSPYPAPVRAPKRRPSAWWFAPGAAFLVAGIVLAAVVVSVFVGMTHTDGYVPPDGHAHRVAVGAGEHMIFSTEPLSRPFQCEGGHAVHFIYDGSTTFSINGTTWYPRISVTTNRARAITCTNRSQTQLRIGGPVSGARIVGSLIGGFAAALLGFLGIVGLVVVAIIYFTRPPRSVTG